MKAQRDALQANSDALLAELQKLMLIKNGWDEEHDPIGAWLYRLYHDGRNTDEQLAFLSQQLEDLGVEGDKLDIAIDEKITGMNTVIEDADLAKESLEKMKREAVDLKRELQEGLGRMAEARTAYKSQEVDEYDDYNQRIADANEDAAKDDIELTEEANKELLDLETNHQDEVARLWADWNATEDLDERARLEREIARVQENYAKEVTDLQSHYETLRENQKTYHEDFLKAEEEAFRERAKQRALEFAREQAERKAAQGAALIDYVRTQAGIHKWDETKSAELMDALAEQYGVQQEISAVTMLSMQRDISKMMTSVEPDIDTLIDQLDETTNAAQTMDEKMQELEEERISALEQQFRIDTQNVTSEEYMELLDDFIKKLEDIPSEVRTTVVTEYVDEQKKQRDQELADAQASLTRQERGYEQASGNSRSRAYQRELQEIKNRYNKLNNDAEAHYDQALASATTQSERSAIEQERQQRLSDLDEAYQREIEALDKKYPQRAIGGTMPFMIPTLVGERGPELVMSRMPNLKILPTHRIGEGMAALQQTMSLTAMGALSGLSGGHRPSGSIGQSNKNLTFNFYNPVVDTPDRINDLEQRFRQVVQEVIDDTLEGSIDALTVQGW